MGRTTSGMNKVYRSKSNCWLRRELKSCEERSDRHNNDLTGRIIMLSNALLRRGQPPTLGVWHGRV